MTSQEDLHEYVNNHMWSKPMGFDQFLWEITVLEKYQEKKSVLFIKIHHSLSDGLGLLSLFGFVNKTHIGNKMPEIKPLSPFFWIRFYAFMPFLLVKFLLSSLRVRQSRETNPLRDVSKTLTGKKTLVESKHWDFNDLRVYKKTPNLTFNNFFISMMSKSWKEQFEQVGSKSDKVVIAIPVNIRLPPKSIDDVTFKNELGSNKTALPLIDSLEDSSRIRKPMKKAFNLSYMECSRVINSWVVPLLPRLIICKMIDAAFENVEACISNTKSGEGELYFCDAKVHDITGFGPNSGKTGIFTLLATYNGKTKITFTADKSLKFCPKNFMRILENNIDAEIAKHKTE